MQLTNLQLLFLPFYLAGQTPKTDATSHTLAEESFYQYWHHFHTNQLRIVYETQFFL